jgi:hypothetical protein
VSLATALLALAKGAVGFGAFKLARFAYGKLQVCAPWKGSLSLSDACLKARCFHQEALPFFQCTYLP